MCDEDIGESQLLLQVMQEVQYLRLDRYVECAHRFVRQDDFRIEGQCPCDSNPLALSAAEFVGVSILESPVQTNPLHEFLDTLFNDIPSNGSVEHAARSIDLQRFGNDGPHGHTGIQ